MLDLNHIQSTPGYDVQQFYGTFSSTTATWQTWRKPRGINWVYMIGVGGGSSGGTGVNTGTSSGGGCPGNSGAQSVVMMPAILLPDVLYIQPGLGGVGLSTSGALPVAGTTTYVSIEPSTTINGNSTILYAGGAGNSGAVAATTTAGGTAATATVLATQSIMCLGYRTLNNLTGAVQGIAGASRTSTTGNSQTIATSLSGLMVSGGAGGGGMNAGTGGNGCFFLVPSGALGQDFVPISGVGATGAIGSTPAQRGADGFICKNFLFFVGGQGGGAASATAGGIAGAGGNGSYGCGGGGSGGSNTTNTTIAKAGDGGPGFVIIISF